MAAKGRQTSATGPSTGAQHQGPLGRTACGSLKPSWPRAELSVTSQIAEGSRKRRIFFLFYSNDHAPIHIHVRRGFQLPTVIDHDDDLEPRARCADAFDEGGLVRPEVARHCFVDDDYSRPSLSVGVGEFTAFDQGHSRLIHPRSGRAPPLPLKRLLTK